MINSNYPFFMNHPFWKYFRIGGNMDFINRLQRANDDARHQILHTAVSGFYPISYLSMISFQQCSLLAQIPTTRNIAYDIFQIESGNRPLIEGSLYYGMRHCDQLKMMFESILGRNLELEKAEKFHIIEELEIHNASLIKILAICEIIEKTAPFVIYFYQDLLIQCQVAWNISSELVKRNYLDEHNLTEGDSTPGQHIGMVNEMLNPYINSKTRVEFEQARIEFLKKTSDHFDLFERNLAALMKVSIPA